MDEAQTFNLVKSDRYRTGKLVIDKKRKMKFCIIDESLAQISQTLQSTSNLHIDCSKFILYFSYSKNKLTSNTKKKCSTNEDDVKLLYE